MVPGGEVLEAVQGGPDADEGEFAFDDGQVSFPHVGEDAPRLVAYGRARIAFLFDHFAIARAALDRSGPVSGAGVDFTRTHIRMLLVQARLDIPGVDLLAVQLAVALEGPILLALSLPERPGADQASGALANSWQTLAERVCRRDLPRPRHSTRA